MSPVVSPETKTPRATRRDEIKMRIFDTAFGLFAEKGYAATSPQDIADAAGITRQALYYYVHSKEEILLTVVSDLTMKTEGRIRAVIHDNPNNGQKLRNLVRLLVTDRANNRARFQMMLRSESELPEALTVVYTNARLEALAMITEILESGIAAGEFRPVHPEVAAQSLAGMCDSVAWWYETGIPVSIDDIADEIAENAVMMVQKVRV
ncbi:TetR/AcrR family transcriptional regulator [Subtercola lobariae]|uniref:HTH-type transcriptional repressor KstR2 n=1 Tax=Subtercola lobariae TaxID=1588641 RepID=A0A917EWG0_9MICO|nr:TetR/AcrR family transcriptional regulator [Subtercola lobariae]GGF21716.1 HTH-type transcriptional repressor KstR2 [Subtercola lobariae]